MSAWSEKYIQAGEEHHSAVCEQESKAELYRNRIKEFQGNKVGLVFKNVEKNVAQGWCWQNMFFTEKKKKRHPPLYSLISKNHCITWYFENNTKKSRTCRLVGYFTTLSNFPCPGQDARLLKLLHFDKIPYKMSRNNIVPIRSRSAPNLNLNEGLRNI